jgi:hypothetical protein
MSAAFEIAGLDAVGQADLVRRGDVSAVELVTWAIERIEVLNPALNPVVTPIFDRALVRAAGVSAGPFAGVPYLLKIWPPKWRAYHSVKARASCVITSPGMIRSSSDDCNARG